MKTSRTRLVLDTATAYLYVAFFEGEKALGEIYEKGDNDHSATLMKTVATLSDSLGVKAADIDEVIVGVGPGSYTGVRAGVVVAKVFAWTRSVSLKTVSSLALIASSVSQETTVVPCLDARRGNVFYGVYDIENGGLRCVEDDGFASLSVIEDGPYKEALRISSGRPDMQKVFRSTLMHDVEDIHALAPRYLRKTEAERQGG